MFLGKNREKLLAAITSDFGISRGHPLPLGATIKREGINFAVFSSNADSINLVIFRPEDSEPIAELPLDPRYNRTGDIWHAFVRGLAPGIEYGYRAERQSSLDNHIHRFNPENILIDPYARALSGNVELKEATSTEVDASAPRPGYNWRCRVVDDEFDWGFDQPLNIHLADSIIYEIHIRGFTRHSSSGVSEPGTFSGIVEKIPYLKDLGITAVELMPVNEFDEIDNPRFNPLTGKRLSNFWGYNSICFFAPKASYASCNKSGDPITEFKKMVKALHEAGIEVILDMVFNHTGEGDERGTTLSFRGLDNSIYYIIDPQTGEYFNYSGCGNTMNCNHPVVRDMVLDCLCYWVTEMHVDGFRFDLASILGRGQDGSVLSNPPLLERIAANPVLANTKLIAEAWDAAGLYQVGSFPNWGRWTEWNGKFRDDVRKFVKGDPGMVSTLATRLCGSADLYQTSNRDPFHSINFITSHDGFTLSDLFSYNNKHNEGNGENGADGGNENYSWNCGKEGPSDSPEINALRNRQTKNMAAILMLSQGTPMMLGGDEIGRTQQGNNNAYCQDNDISWVNWDLLDCHKDLYRFFKRLIGFRKNHPALRRRSFVKDGPDQSPAITWHGVRLNQPDWSWESRSLGMYLNENPDDNDIFFIANAASKKIRFKIPKLNDSRKWFRFVDTSLEMPDDIAEPDREELLSNQGFYNAGARSVVVLIAK